ncbi:TPA: LysM peptidoglycan-binding domain-containing protein [Pseudomonas aeruginosa]
MNKANECTCPSGDGSLVHPCPAHPAVEQAGGDERAACNLWIAEQQLCQGSDISLFKLERNGALVSLHDLLRDAYQAGQARAALAQPSPAQAEAEQPEVVAWQYRVTAGPQTGWSLWHPGKGEEFERSYTVERRPLMTVAQHERIVGALRADRDSWAEQAEQRLADWDEMRKERDAALARVAELERQEPVALANRGLHAFWVKWTEAAAGLYGPGIKLYAAPVVQAQQLHDLDKQCRDDVARALGLRPNQERGFAWSYLLASIKSCVKASEDSAQAQHSVPAYVSYTTQPAESLAGIALRQLKDESRWVEIRDINAHAFPDMRSHSYYPAGTVIKLPAAAPGKEVGHE